MATEDNERTPPFSAPDHVLLSYAVSLGSGLAQDAFLADLAAEDESRADLIRALLEARDQSEWHERFTPAKGVRVGEFELVRPIGAGGFGSVWLAKRDADRTPAVALKLLHASKMSEMSLSRFEREREALRQIQHAGVVALLGEGNHAGAQPYLALEYVKGCPIHEFVEQQELAREQRLELLVQTARAAHAAHARNIVHRDIKPKNVLVASTSDGPRVKLVDFGLAHSIGDRNTALEIGDTEANTQLGTLEYMPPEQTLLSTDFLGREPDARTDVFALGRLAFEVLTGERAIDLGAADTPIRLGKLKDCFHHSLPSRAATRAAGLSEDLDGVLRRAQQTNPEDRYSSAAEFAEDLERVLRGELPRANRQNKRAAFRHFVRRYAVAMAAAALILALLVSVIVVLFRSERRVIRDRVQLESAVAAYEDVFDNLSPRDLAIHLREDLMAQGEGLEVVKFEALDFTTAANQALMAKVLRPAISQVRQLPEEAQPRMLNRFARLALRFGDVPLAAELVERALAILSGSADDRTAAGVELRLDRAALDRLQGNHEKAGALLSALRDGKHGPLDPTQVARVLSEEIATALELMPRTNLKQLAAELIQHVEASDQIEPRHAWIALSNAGSALFEMGSFAEARPVIERVLELIKAAPKREVDDLLTNRMLLARINSAAERHDDACRDLEEIDRETIWFHGRWSRRRLRFLMVKAEIESAADRVEEAAATTEECAAVMERLPGSSDLERLVVLTNSRISLVGQGVPEKARAGLDVLMEEARAAGPFGQQLANGLVSVDIFARAEMGERESLEAEFAPLVTEVAGFGPSGASMHRSYLEQIIAFYETWQGEGAPRDVAPEISHWKAALEALDD